MIAPDSSVTIAAAAPWHVLHDAAVHALAVRPPQLIAHVGFETVAALSRMPEGHRVPASIALQWLEERFAGRWLTLDPGQMRTAVKAAVGAGVRGGALYDGLIASTAVAHGQVLLSADRRAQRTYAALGANVRWLGSV